MQDAVFVADHHAVGPKRCSADEETQPSGALAKFKFQMRDVGVARLEGREEWSAGGGHGGVLVSGAVDEADFARRGSQWRFFGTVWRSGGLVETGAQLDDVVAVRMVVDLDDGVSEVTVDLAEILFLPARKIGLMADG